MNPDNENTENRKSNEEFPGYPHYPAKEDIMNSPGKQRIDVDLEKLSRSHKPEQVTDIGLGKESINPDELRPAIGDEDDLHIVPGTEADVTPDDLLILGMKDADFAMGETVTGEDLDVPGSEDDDANEAIGEEDEENNYYSLGGDAHENLEEDNG